MSRCDTCGIEYDKSFQITSAGGARHTFDCFECAIERLAPRCKHCNCHIIGHGIEAGGSFFCCASCAAHSGIEDARDRV